MKSESQPGSALVIITTLLIMGVSTARWYRIAIGDFAWTYDSAIRIARGELPYIDYISALPQLTSVTLAGLIRLFVVNQ